MFMDAEVEVEENPQHITLAATTLKLLSNEQRLLLLCRITHGETHVGDLVQHSGLAQSSVSQYLARLRIGGLVTARRKGTMIYYSLSQPELATLIHMLCTYFAQCQIKEEKS